MGHDDMNENNAQFVKFEKGDLLHLNAAAGENLRVKSWAEAKNEKSGEEGHIHSNNVYILPTLQKPDQNILKLFKMSDTELHTLRIFDIHTSSYL